MFLLQSTTEAFNIVLAILLLIASYILGSIPFGVLIGKSRDIDIREHGSKNIGTTNSIRVLGKKLGFTVFFFDVFKGMAVILLIKLLAALNVWSSPIDLLWYGALAIIGHSFSMFLEFEGGKAVATSLGVVLVLCPLAAIACLLIFFITLIITGYVSLGSTFASLTVVLTGWVLYFINFQSSNAFSVLIASPGLAVCILFTIATALIIIKHTKNYKRLLNGTENSFKKKKTD